jgi:hypothetical protein
MSRLPRCAALAVLTALVASSGAYARSNHNSANPLAGAHNGASDMDIRQQCHQEALTRWPSTSQDMQTNRDFAYRACAVDHGVRNP